MPPIPLWALILTYWLHMLAVVVWIGSLTAISILILPASHRTLNLVQRLSLISALQKRLEPIAWFSIGMLAFTGLIQMSTSEHYDGFLNISTQWSLAILAKHILGGLMILVSAIQTWEVIPAMQRILIKKEKADESELAKLQKRESRLIHINIFLSLLALGATAIARVS
ncbi:MAG: CopD family protein [Anaerolineales bacterium]